MVGERSLVGRHRGVEVVEFGSGGPLLLDLRSAEFAVGGKSCAQIGDIAPGEMDSERREFLDEIAMTTRCLGLLLQGAQTAAHLAHEVLDPGEVAVGGGETAFGSVLPLPELQDAGGLLDDRPAVLGAGVEHGVDLALADDHVLLTADATVGQQFGDVEQAARHAVEGVLGVTAAEERAGDLHLAELHGERATVVVDGERHLSAAEGGLVLAAGEDDVVHLPGPHGRRRLCTENPSNGIDDVRLARAVRTDHDRDPWFEIDRGGVGERLEALQREVLQMHRVELNNPNYIRVVLGPGEIRRPLWIPCGNPQGRSCRGGLMSGGQTWVSQK